MAKLTRSRAYSLQLFSSLTGLAVSVYLLVQHTRVKNGIQGSASFCSFGRYADCDVVNSSPYSEVLGFPLATLGALFYVALFALAVLSPPNHSSFGRTQRALAILATFGLFVDAVLLGIQIGLLRNFCLLCFVTYLATIGAAYSVAKLSEVPGKWWWQLIEIIKSRKKGAGPPLTSSLVAATLFTGLSAAVVLLPAQIVLTSSTHQRVENVIEKFMDEWKDKQKRNIDVKSSDASIGNSASRIRIVAFSDFECPHCQHAAFTMNTTLKLYQDRVFFVFKHYPLDSSCNRKVNFRLHENSCQLARLSFCANQKGKFWEFHDDVFKRAAKGDKPGWAQFKVVVLQYLSEKEIEKCLASPASLRNTQSDIQLGDNLGLTGTPSIYINGKLVKIPITIETIQRLIEMELSL